MQPHDVIITLRRRGVLLLATADEKLRVEGVELLTETEKAALKAHKPALLQALRQSAAAVDDRPTETPPRAPVGKDVPLAMATGRIAVGRYAPNCNRCHWYRWRTATCQRQGRVAFPTDPPCGGPRYQPFAPTLTERAAAAADRPEEVP